MDMQLKKIADEVYACLQKDKGWCYDNTMYVARGEGLLVDTMFDLAHNRNMIDLFRELGGPWPPRYVINTHHDGDHVFGNQLFPDSEIIGHRLCPKEMSRESRPDEYAPLINPPEDAPDWLRYISPAWQEWDLSGVVPTPPTFLIDDRHTIDLDGLTVDILHAGPAHMVDDLIVHLSDLSILATGDLTFKNTTPVAWAGPFGSIMRAFDLIESLQPRIVIPGHGPLCGLEGPRENRSYYEFVYRESQRGFADGLSPLETARRVQIGPYARWQLPERLVINMHLYFKEFYSTSGNEPRDAVRIFEDFFALAMHWKG